MGRSGRRAPFAKSQKNVDFPTVFRAGSDFSMGASVLVRLRDPVAVPRGCYSHCAALGRLPPSVPGARRVAGLFDALSVPSVPFLRCGVSLQCAIMLA